MLKLNENEKQKKEEGRALQLWITDKQKIALTVLRDNVTTELVYGGAAGGAKSFLGAAWLVMNCFEYRGSRWLLGRAVLKQLKQSTLLTLFDVCKRMHLKQGVDYVYNAQEGVIRFKESGSEIYLKDLAYYPSDPDFDSLGSTEYTGAFIDEASQVREKAKNVVKSRLRYKLDEFKILPKMLMTCNPSKNFLYTEFYKPWKNGELKPGKAFIMARVEDNPWLPKAYIESLNTLDKNSRERLLKGNWEYDDDPAALMDFDSITDLFTNTPEWVPGMKDNMGRHIPDWRKVYLVADIARFGSDRTVITIWRDFECISIESFTKTSTTTVAGLIKERAARHNIPSSHIIVDEDGIGGGVKDQLYGIKGFIAQTKAARGENYTNLKSQCSYTLARKVQAREIQVSNITPENRQSLIEELEQIKAKDIDKDGKMAIVSKDDVKAALGRSPDISDCFMMRMAFEFIAQPRLTFIGDD